jgi:two-component system response regulator YesN
MLTKIRLPLFYQYLLSYIFILIIPLLIIVMVVYTYFVVVLEEQLTAYNERMVVQTKDLVDAELSNIVKISLKLSSDPALSPYSMEQLYNVYRSKILLNYSETNGFFYDLLLYIRNKEALYSSRSTYSLKTYYNQEFQFKNWPYDSFVNDLNNIQKLTIRPAGDVLMPGSEKERFVTYLVPLPIQSATPHSTAIFIIKESSFQQLFKSIFNYKKSSTIMLDTTGRVLTSSQSEIPLLSEQIRKQIVDERGSSTRTVEIMNVLYFLSYVSSQETGFTYVSVVPQTELMEKVDTVKMIALAAIGAVLVLGGLLIYLMMHLHYNPLRNLIRWSEQTWGQASHMEGIDKVRSAIDYAARTRDHLQSQLAFSEPIAKDHLLVSLLKGKPTDIQLLNELGRSFGISFSPASPYFVIIIQYDKEIDQADADMLREIWEGILARPMDGCRTDMFDNSSTSWIVAGDPKHIPRSSWENIRKRYSGEMREGVSMGIGDVCGDIMQINRSYLEAYTSLYHKPVFGGERIRFYWELGNDSKQLFWYPKTETAQLELLLKQGDTEKALSVVGEIVRKVKENNITLLMAKYICFDIINTISKEAASALRTDRSNDELSNVLMQIMEMHSFDDIERHMFVLSNKMLAALDDLASHRKPELLEQMELYMDKFVYSSQFSVQSMAQQFSLTATYLGRYFKEHTGMTLMDYVTGLRIERAKQLLKEKELPLHEMVQLIGFSDVSSFIRKFKQIVKVTPGDFRAIAKAQSENREGG